MEFHCIFVLRLRSNIQKCMKLNVTALSILRGNKDIWTAAMKALGVQKDTMYKYIRDNSQLLTKAAVLKVLREGTGLSDSELLEDETVGAIK